MVLLGTICCIHVGGELLQLMLSDVCHHGVKVWFLWEVGVGGRERSSQICITPWYVSTGGIIVYTKKNRFENSCTVRYCDNLKPHITYLGGGR